MNSKGDAKVAIGNGLSGKYIGDNAAVDLEKAISLTGFGKFQYLIIALCGLIYCCVGFQNGLNAYVIPSAECDLKMTSSEKGLLNAAFLTGGLASSFFWGVLADYIGRKKVLVFSLVLDGTVNLAASFSQTFIFFTIFRFLSGFLIGAPGSILLAYLGEFLTDKQRPPCLCAVGFFWTISWMILPAAALGIIPITWSYRTDGFLYNSWRIYVAVFAIPTIISGFLLKCFFPESPRFLFSQHRKDEVLTILKNMYAVTNGKNSPEFPVKMILSEEKVPTQEKNIHATKDTGFLVSEILKQLWSQISYLFSYPIICSTVLASSLVFSNMFGYYGLGLWLPELFSRFEAHYKVSNVSVSVCELAYSRTSPSVTVEPYLIDNSTLDYELPPDGECSGEAINPTVFLNTFIIGASCLIGNIMSAMLANRVGLKALLIATAIVSGICSISIYFLKTPSQNLLVSCIFLTFVGAENMIISSAIVDLFDTKVRALAVCTAIFAGRLAAVASNLTLGYLLDISCEIPIFLMGSILLSGGFLGFFLPKKKPGDR